MKNTIIKMFNLEPTAIRHAELILKVMRLLFSSLSQKEHIPALFVAKPHHRYTTIVSV